MHAVHTARVTQQTTLCYNMEHFHGHGKQCCPAIVLAGSSLLQRCAMRTCHRTTVLGPQQACTVHEQCAGVDNSFARPLAVKPTTGA
jgi:hypothetical protein